VHSYPPDAYSPSGQPWWELRTWPGKPAQKFGTEPRLAAYLRFNAEPGGILTLRKLREALGEPNRPNDHEHFNRRFRQLRKYGWTVLSSRAWGRPIVRFDLAVSLLPERGHPLRAR
jgi:hypothetical protein